MLIEVAYSKVLWNSQDTIVNHRDSSETTQPRSILTQLDTICVPVAS